MSWLVESFLDEGTKSETNTSLSAIAESVDSLNESGCDFSYRDQAIMLNTIMEAEELMELDEGANMSINVAFHNGKKKFNTACKAAKQAIKSRNKAAAKKHINEMYKIVVDLEKDIKKYDSDQTTGTAIIGLFLNSFLFLFKHFYLVGAVMIPIVGPIINWVVELKYTIDVLITMFNDIKKAKEISPAQFNLYRQALLKYTNDLKSKIKKLESAANEIK